VSEGPRKKRVGAKARLLLLLLLAIASGCLARPYVENLLHRGPVPIGMPTPRPEGEGWIDLLDAANAPHWKNLGDSLDIFEIEDGILHIHGRTIYPLRYATYTAQTFADFDLHLEYKVARRANSGVFLRATPNDPVNRGFEVQVLDDFGKRPSKNGAGAIYDVVTPMYNLSRPAGEWNSLDITAKGKQISVTLNGWKVIECDFAKMTEPIGKFPIAYTTLPLEGNLALQDHGGEVWYRNILIRPLAP